MSAILIWHPERLTARLLAAATPARVQAAGIARSNCASKRVAASIVVAGDRIAATDPLAGIIEGGAKPHAIAPRNRQALKLASGDFVSGDVNHPGTPARPFLRPILPLWPTLYRRQAAGAFRGF